MLGLASREVGRTGTKVSNSEMNGNEWCARRSLNETGLGRGGRRVGIIVESNLVVGRAREVKEENWWRGREEVLNIWRCGCCKKKSGGAAKEGSGSRRKVTARRVATGRCRLGRDEMQSCIGVVSGGCRCGWVWAWA
jgi:hypothetical protein